MIHSEEALLGKLHVRACGRRGARPMTGARIGSPFWWFGLGIKMQRLRIVLAGAIADRDAGLRIEVAILPT